jgi:hypothetical protein
VGRNIIAENKHSLQGVQGFDEHFAAKFILQKFGKRCGIKHFFFYYKVLISLPRDLPRKMIMKIQPSVAATNIFGLPRCCCGQIGGPCLMSLCRKFAAL